MRASISCYSCNAVLVAALTAEDLILVNQRHMQLANSQLPRLLESPEGESGGGC